MFRNTSFASEYKFKMEFCSLHYANNQLDNGISSHDVVGK